jgi:hypothetical protein
MLDRFFLFLFSFTAIFLIFGFLTTPLKATGCCATDTICSSITEQNTCEGHGCFPCNTDGSCECQWSNGKCSGTCTY